MLDLTQLRHVFKGDAPAQSKPSGLGFAEILRGSKPAPQTVAKAAPVLQSIAKAAPVQSIAKPTQPQQRQQVEERQRQGLAPNQPQPAASAPRRAAPRTPPRCPPNPPAIPSPSRSCGAKSTTLWLDARSKTNKSSSTPSAARLHRSRRPDKIKFHRVAVGMRGASAIMVLNWLYRFWEALTNPCQRTPLSDPSALRAPRRNQDAQG